jgi:hypothetical protein
MFILKWGSLLIIVVLAFFFINKIYALLNLVVGLLFIFGIPKKNNKPHDIINEIKPNDIVINDFHENVVIIPEIEECQNSIMPIAESIQTESIFSRGVLQEKNYALEIISEKSDA